MTRCILLDFLTPIKQTNYESSLKKRKINSEEDEQLKKDDHLLENLSRKLNTKIPVAFSLNFKFVTSHEEDMERPLDVKISYRNEIILVSDIEDKSIHVFGLRTGKYKFTCYPEKRPIYLAIEENYDGNNNEALICSTEDYYYKYDLLELLKSRERNQAKSIWRTNLREYNCQSCVIKHSDSGNTLYCCNNENAISVYSCADGSLLRQITYGILYDEDEGPTEYTFPNPIAIDYNFNDGAPEFVLSFFGGVCYIRESLDGSWVVREVLESFVRVETYNGGVKFKTLISAPCIALIDKSNHNVIVCSFGNQSIAVYGSDGKFLKTFDSNSKFKKLSGCCINELTGELLVIVNKRLKIYK